MREAGDLVREGPCSGLAIRPNSRFILLHSYKDWGSLVPSITWAGAGNCGISSSPTPLSTDSLCGSVTQEGLLGVQGHQSRATEVLQFGMRKIYDPLTSYSPLQALTPKESTRVFKE